MYVSIRVFQISRTKNLRTIKNKRTTVLGPFYVKSKYPSSFVYVEPVVFSWTSERLIVGLPSIWTVVKNFPTDLSLGKKDE